ncbi:MAG: hypothetical protein QOD71_3297 [Thermoleophilaceae bacterium]|jgi:hypothetical protein|nr:hypothetical protein [Thermoleophilaceae bacterium]
MLLGLFGLGALLSGLTIRWGINPHDEGLMLQAGERIADGQLPYRDFYANYGPGQYFLIGALDWLFGPSLIAWRIVRVALDAGVAVLAYALVRRDAPEPLALGAWLAVAAAMSFPSIPHPNPTALALAFGGLLLAQRRPAAAGALAGVAAVFRFDLGAGALAGVALLAATAGGRRAAARAALTGLAVALVLLAPVVIAAPRDFWDQTIGFALDEQGLQRLPLPGAWEGGFEPNKILQHFFPYVLLGGTVLWLLVALVRRLPARLWAPAPLAGAGVVYLLARADEFHLVPLAPVLAVLLATAAAHERRAGRTASAVVLVVVLGLIAIQGLDRKRIQLLDPPPLATIHVDVADGVEAPPAEARALTQLSHYVRERVPPGRPVFVANPRFDLVRVGNPLVYVLVGRPNPTRYDVMQPGVVTTAPVQREIVRDLERSRPRLVIRWLSPVADQREDNGAGRSSGVRLLDRYLARTYAPRRRFGDYLVLTRR